MVRLFIVTNLSRIPDRLLLVCQLIISLCWLWAAFTKLLDVSTFEEALQLHGVVSQASIPTLAYVVPAVELLLGSAIIALGRSRLGSVLATSVSAVTLIAFTWYIVWIPDAAIKAKGCGCMGLPARADHVHLWPLARNGVLLGLHALVVMVRPGVAGSEKPVA